MRLILFFLLVTGCINIIYAQTVDEQALLKHSIVEATMKGFRATRCVKTESAYATMVIEFSRKGFPHDVFFFGATECFNQSKDEIRQKLLVSLSTQVILDRKEFSNAYIIVPVLLSQAQTVLPENLTLSESWPMAFKDFNTVSLQKKHLKYIIPIEILISLGVHKLQ